MKALKNNIYVTRAFFPPIKEFTNYVERIWKNQWLTNRGELIVRLEEDLKEFLGVDNMLITNNGTIPIQIALKLLAGNGEVITTPFSYIATSSAIIWENCKPVFVDITPDFLTIDEQKIEAKITDKTTAILATHVFGNPCNVEVIEHIAKVHGLKVIYDAAHCFGVTYKGQSLFNYGDVSTCSFHATKLFHTGEGGAVFSKDKNLMDKFFHSHNFGHNGPLDFYGLGINAKASELQGAMGLSVLSHMKEILGERKRVVTYYNEYLNFQKIRKIKLRDEVIWNYSYYPIIFNSEEELLKVEDILNRNNIFPRRYFNPSLNTVTYIKGEKMPISESISERVICLPLYVGLEESNLKIICELINNSF